MPFRKQRITRNSKKLPAKPTVINKAKTAKTANISKSTAVTPMPNNGINEIAHKPNFPLIVTAYTVSSHLGDYYKRAVARFTKSCIKHDLKHIVYPLNQVGDWVKGCNLKPTVILDALQTFKQPILWIDADAVILRRPEIFDNVDFDMALHVQGSGHWLSGTLYFSTNAIDFVKDWKEVTTSSTPDEITLLNLYRNRANKPKMLALPKEYNQVVHAETDLKDLIIGHYIRPDIAPNRGVKSILPGEL